MTLAEKKHRLFPLLQKAMELELSTIPPYLTALLSITQRTNRVAANLIRSVMMEEMLHMILIGNVTSSLGGKVHLGAENIPSYPLRMEFDGKAFMDREFNINLERFSQHSLNTFLRIEIPADRLQRHVTLLAKSSIEIPGITIGAFYQRVIHELEALCTQYAEKEVFCGNPEHQIDQRYYWSGGGKPVVVTSLASAKEALGVIVKQGEGGHHSIDDGDTKYFHQPEEIGHYYRFNEIAQGRHYKPGDHPKNPPSGDTFEVDFNAVSPIKLNPKQSDYAPGSHLAKLNRSFNTQYSLMLRQLETAFNGTPSVMYDAIIHGMHGMAPIAAEMMGLPIEEGGDTHGAPSFEWVSPPVI
jgi:Ferritin-like